MSDRNQNIPPQRVLQDPVITGHAAHTDDHFLAQRGHDTTGCTQCRHRACRPQWPASRAPPHHPKHARMQRPACTTRMPHPVGAPRLGPEAPHRIFLYR